MRQARIHYNDTLAGLLTETDEGDYIFQYDKDYVLNQPGQFLSFTMPVRSEPYQGKRLFPFFDGLIPEGWLLEIAESNWKIDRNDRMGLLMACCHNCIGAASVEPMNKTHHA